jgi:hypothetical protein
LNSNLHAGDNGTFQVTLLGYPSKAPVLFIGSPGPQEITLSNGISDYTWEIVYSDVHGLTNSSVWHLLPNSLRVIPTPAANVYISDPDPRISNRLYRAVWVTCQ